MASLSPSWLFQDQSAGNVSSFDYAFSGKPCCRNFQTPFVGAYNPQKLSSQKSDKQFHVIKCTKNDRKFDPSSIEPPPYHSYMDSTSGKLEPACGARASIPGREYWPEGTANQVAAARAPEPVGKSDGKPSYGKNPGSRRRKYKGLATASEAAESSSEAAEISTDTSEQPVLGTSETDVSVDEPKDPSEEYVIYQTEQEENLTPYELDKAMGRPHPFVDPSKPPVGEPRSSEDLWWNWRKKENEFWSRWKKRAPDVDTVFAKAMAEAGQIKLHGDHPTKAESLLAKTRRHIFKEERLQAEQRRLKEIGPIAYYSEWVKAWDRDTSREAIQKHYEETGEDENIQLITMFEHQTAEEYHIMMGTDVRIKRDPLAIRMREDLIKEIWGGDPVYPTINYIQDPDEVIDYRGPDFHEPTPSPLAYLMEEGEIISRQELEKILTKDKKQEMEVNDMDDAMASAVDIGEDDDGRESEEGGGEGGGGEGEGEGDGEGDDEKITSNWSVMKTTPQLRKSKEGEIISRQELEKILTKDKKQEMEVNDMDDAMASAVDIGEDDDGRESEEGGGEEGGEGEGEGDGEGENEKITRNWSVMKTTPQLRKSKEKPKKAGPMSLEEAVDDSENLTDFLMDFDEEE